MSWWRAICEDDDDDDDDMTVAHSAAFDLLVHIYPSMEDTQGDRRLDK